MFVWRGVGASEEEMAAAKHVVGILGGSASDVSEGKEPGKDFMQFSIFIVLVGLHLNSPTCLPLLVLSPSSTLG